MLVVFENDKKQYDFIVLTSINFALLKLGLGGEPVVPYSSTLDFSDVTRLALVGHGNIGRIQSVSADVIGTHLADPVRGITKKLTKLLVTSCHAGERVGGVAGTSLVEVLAEKIRHRGVGGLEIVGYNGPSIKSAELGFFVTVVNPADFDQAKLLSGQATAQSGQGLGALTTGFVPGQMPTLGQNASALSKNFYQTFIDKLDHERLLLRGDDVARIAVVLD
jgi:hypothetical protein